MGGEMQAECLEAASRGSTSNANKKLVQIKLNHWRNLV